MVSGFSRTGVTSGFSRTRLFAFHDLDERRQVLVRLAVRHHAIEVPADEGQSRRRWGRALRQRERKKQRCA